MSNIYIQEPPTSGKVLMQTTAGDIDIELWAKETPKAARNFIQLCLENYYDGTIFHRVVKDFIVQGGDPTGTGTGGESVYGHPFKDEFHTRLRFVRRGLVAMANAGKDDNGSQFFFTLGACSELQNKHTIFGKITGNTLYNMLKLGDSLVDRDDRPIYPHKIIKTKVLNNPFEDIVPRVIKKETSADKKDEKKSTAKATKNFKLLSFGDEAEEDEEEVNAISKKYSGKSKSSHDLIDDPKLSSVPAVPVDGTPTATKKVTENVPSGKGKTSHDPVEETKEESPVEVEENSNSKKRSAESDTEESKAEKLEKVKKKLKKEVPEKEVVDIKTEEKPASVQEEEKETKMSKAEELRKEVEKLKRELARVKKKNEAVEKSLSEEKKTVPVSENEVVKEYYEETKKYQDLRKTQKKKGSEREEQTLALLAKFQQKLQAVKKTVEETQEETHKSDVKEKEEEEEDDDPADTAWLAHSLHFETHEAKVKDANINDEDTYEIFDPRNPINQRRREASKQAMQRSKR